VTGSRDSSLRVWTLPKEQDPRAAQSMARFHECRVNSSLASCTMLPIILFIYIISRDIHGTSEQWQPMGVLARQGHNDTTVRMWNLNNGKCVHVLKGHLQLDE
jgi:F-box and WD-40 domain protein CDC4